MDARRAELLLELRARLEAAPRGQRQGILDGTAAFLGVSVATAYRELKALGYGRNRKRRSDAGKTCIDKELAQTVSGHVGKMRVSSLIYRYKNNFENILPALIPAILQAHRGQFGTAPVIGKEGQKAPAKRRGRWLELADAFQIQEGLYGVPYRQDGKCKGSGVCVRPSANVA